MPSCSYALASLPPDPNDVTVTLDGVADDGEGGENDNVDNDVENVLGRSRQALQQKLKLRR